MICENCGERIVTARSHVEAEICGDVSYFCSPKAERSEALQGCSPSATGSADARAADETVADSAGRSADESEPPRVAVHEGLGNWFLRDELERRIIALCCRKTDADLIAKALEEFYAK